MITVGMHYDVLPGKEKEFETGFHSVLEHLKTVTGHVDSHLYQDVFSAGSYLIVSEWAGREHFEAFIHSDAFKKVVGWGKAEILRGRPRHKVYG